MTPANRAGIGHQVAGVAIRIASIRNECLYPISQPDGSHKHPKNNLSATIVKLMVQRAKGIVRVVKRII